MLLENLLIEILFILSAHLFSNECQNQFIVLRYKLENFLMEIKYSRIKFRRRLCQQSSYDTLKFSNRRPKNLIKILLKIQ